MKVYVGLCWSMLLRHSHSMWLISCEEAPQVHGAGDNIASIETLVEVVMIGSNSGTSSDGSSIEKLVFVKPGLQVELLKEVLKTVSSFNFFEVSQMIGCSQ